MKIVSFDTRKLESTISNKIYGGYAVCLMGVILLTIELIQKGNDKTLLYSLLPGIGLIPVGLLIIYSNRKTLKKIKGYRISINADKIEILEQGNKSSYTIGGVKIVTKLKSIELEEGSYKSVIPFEYFERIRDVKAIKEAIEKFALNGK